MIHKRKTMVRLSLDLSPDANAVLERLAEDKGVSKADILRRAIVLIEAVTEAKKGGLRVGVVEAMDKEALVTEVVGL